MAGKRASVKTRTEHRTMVFWAGDLANAESPDRLPESASIAVAFMDGVVIRTALHTGHVDVDVELLERRPADAALRGDAVSQEVSLELLGPLFTVGSMAGGDVILDLDLPDFEEGWWRVRVTSTGRSQAVDDGVGASDERYEILMWPEDETPASPLLTSGASGA